MAAPRSTVLSEDEEAMVITFQRHTLLPLDDCLYAFQPSTPHLTRSSLHRCLQRHGISRLPEVEGNKPKRQKFKRYSIGYFHIDIAEVRTEEGKLHLFVAIDRTSKFAVAQLIEKANRKTAWEFLEHRLTKPSHPWSNGQVERMNRTIKEATVKRYHYCSHEQLRSHPTIMRDGSTSMKSRRGNRQDLADGLDPVGHFVIFYAGDHRLNGRSISVPLHGR